MCNLSQYFSTPLLKYFSPIRTMNPDIVPLDSLLSAFMYKNLLCCLYTFSPGSCKLPDPLYASSSWAQTNPASSASPHTWGAEHFVFLASPVCQHTSQTEGLKYEFSITDTASPAACFPVVCNYLAHPGSISAVGPYRSLPTRMFYDSTILFKTSYQITDTSTGV